MVKTRTNLKRSVDRFKEVKERIKEQANKLRIEKEKATRKNSK